jgi:hypothetical protein
MILLVYNAENLNIDAEDIRLNFILINHWAPDSPWSTFLAAFAWTLMFDALTAKSIITHDLTGL